ncbi:MAG: hypothetical protein LBC77_04475 [Spirochaetaceae bacterium]|jgi:phage FluMu protein Com|nr:hypothetical protein [Spirochaetaceae bacterium]
MKKIEAEHNLQLKCDNPKCGYLQEIQEEDAAKYVGAKCPKCGEIILTLADYKKHRCFMKIANFFLRFVPTIRAKKGSLAIHIIREKKEDGKHHIRFWFEK